MLRSYHLIAVIIPSSPYLDHISIIIRPPLHHHRHTTTITPPPSRRHRITISVIISPSSHHHLTTIIIPPSSHCHHHVIVRSQPSHHHHHIAICRSTIVAPRAPSSLYHINIIITSSSERHPSPRRILAEHLRGGENPPGLKPLGFAYGSSNI